MNPYRNTMGKHLIALVLMLFTYFGSQAESDFREGFIININNDTTYGFINYEGLFQNARVCHFKKDETSKIQVYFPKDLTAYRFTDSRYFQSIPINTGTETEILFLECLIQGKVDIYRCYFEGMSHFYARKENGPLRELRDEKKTVLIDGTSYIKDSKEYIGVLKTFFAESPDIIKRVDNMYLTQKSLVGMAHDFHYATCTDGDCIIFEKSLRPKNHRFQFGASTGINAYQFKALESPRYLDVSWEQYEFSKVVYPSIGLFIRKNLPSIHDRIFIQYEAQWGQDKLLGKAFDYTVYLRDHYTCIRYNRQFIRQALLVRREYTLGKNSIAMHLGGFLDNTFKSTYKHTSETWNSAGHLVEVPILLDTDNPFHQFDVGLSAGVDYSIPLNSKISLFADLSYQTCVGIIGNNTDNTSKNFLSFNLGLAFGK